MQAAMVNRSIRTIKAELEFLTDASVISPDTLNELLQRIPQQTALHAPLSVGALPGATPGLHAPADPMANLNLNRNSSNSNQLPQTNGYANDEKRNGFASPQNETAQAPPPPAYNSTPPPAAAYPPLAQATALYAYTSGDAGDLEFQPNDHITVIEYMNAEWWKGRSSRTGQEGIFPRSYVKVIEEKSAQQNNYSNNYGNMPLEVSQVGNGEGKVPTKTEQQGKKFGKKLGNAAIFGAGATIGGNIVNSIF
ncbi:SH3-domain-containing protein [Polychaeton citri CBS 116435]|uniref:SH3-domain-containing protein n=1 Tax=Polychaeton citri CBS 116435 TaxID=1314669 RepID=A0A9P4UUY3_9PEZI|nr:SH3-domain-containing protein [Polychaeton citri CBS 116435]